MNNKSIEKDERTIFVENASHKFGYNFITFALLMDVIYRSLRFNEAPWDLLVIIIISGFVMGIYQYKQKILGRTWLRITGLALFATAVIAFILAFILNRL